MRGRLITTSFMNLSNGILVFLGGGTGAVLRYLLSLVIKSPASGFPSSTFWVNVIGCFIIGCIFSFLHTGNQSLKLLCIVGLLGGFTTFSSFGIETIRLFKLGDYRMAFFYISLSNICGLGAVYLGTKLSSFWGIKA